MPVTAYSRRGFLGGARQTTLDGDHTDSVTTVACLDLSTWAGVTSNGPGTATIAEGKADEETITFTGISSNSLTGVTRGAAGTAPQAHSSGVTISHGSSKIDFDEANAHLADPTLNHHTQYPLKTLWSAKGTILAATAASTPAGLAVGTDGQVLTADAASSGGVKWSSAGGGLLSHVQYAPDPAATYAGTASVAALDATHMRLPDFAPPSTLVRVVISGVIYDVAAADGKRPAVCIITQGTTTVIGALINIEGGLSAYAHTFHAEQYITVVAGTTYHWDVGYLAQGTSGPTIYAYGGTTGGTAGGPLVCSVFAT